MRNPGEPFLTFGQVYVKILTIKKVTSRETGGLERLCVDQFFRTAALWPVINRQGVLIKYGGSLRAFSFTLRFYK
jgi:hypothetical protein